MTKKLKFWNGRNLSHKYKRTHINVCAYSEKQATEIIEEVLETYIGKTEIRNYFSKCWGNPMDGIIPTEPSLYLEIESGYDGDLTNVIINGKYRLLKLYPKNDTINI